MQAQQAMLTFTEVEKPLGDRLLKLALEIDRFEGYSQSHAVAIARLSEKLGALVGLHGSDLTALKFAALAHDVGERSMKRNYLLRPDALTWEERIDLWRHPIIGEQAAVELKLPRYSQLLIRWHHEWWNGQGYPDGLTGLAIPLGARILRTADSYCALISNRPYRSGFEALDAEQTIADQAGIELDPQIVKLLLMLLADERKGREAQAWQSPSAFYSEPAQIERPPIPIEMAREDPVSEKSPAEHQLGDYRPAGDHPIVENQTVEDQLTTGDLSNTLDLPALNSAELANALAPPLETQSAEFEEPKAQANAEDEAEKIIAAAQPLTDEIEPPISPEVNGGQAVDNKDVVNEKMADTTKENPDSGVGPESPKPSVSETTAELHAADSNKGIEA